MGFKLRGMTRKPDGEGAKALKSLGVEIVRGDLDDVDSLKAPLGGARGIYAVQNTWEAGVEREEEQGKRIARLARESGIQLYVHASVASAHRETGSPPFENKRRVEEINDEQAKDLAGQVAQKIQAEVEYPGQIKVTVIRETRAVDYAK